MKCGVIFLMFILCQLCATAQSFNQVPAYPAATAYSQFQSDAFAYTVNQACLAEATGISAGVYGERRFMLAALSNYLAVITLPVSFGGFGCKAGYAGSVLYNETTLAFAYAKKMGNRLSVGAQFNYYGVRIAGYDQASFIGFELGVLAHLSSKLQAGVQIVNPIGMKHAREKMPASFSLGFGYEPSDKVLLSMNISKEEMKTVNVNTGVVYQIIHQLSVRLGISSAPTILWLGTGLSLGNAVIHLSGGFHPTLGWSPAFLLTVPFHKKKA